MCQFPILYYLSCFPPKYKFANLGLAESLSFKKCILCFKRWNSVLWGCKCHSPSSYLLCPYILNEFSRSLYLSRTALQGKLIFNGDIKMAMFVLFQMVFKVSSSIQKAIFATLIYKRQSCNLSCLLEQEIGKTLILEPKMAI